MNLQDLLERHDLGQYAAVFAQADLDLATLTDLSEQDLVDLGLPLGARRRLQKALRGGSGSTTPPGENRLGEPTQRPGPAPGEAPSVIDGYAVHRVLGQGGMGAVFQVVDKHSQRPVALKTLQVELLQAKALRQRFRQEYGLLQGLTHPGIVRVFAMGEDPRWGLYYTMELVEGGTLAEWLHRHSPPPADCHRVWDSIVQALIVAHAAGVVHRDLKPQNVLLRRDGQPVIVDWGLGGASQQARSRTQALGTPGWASPEQAEGQTGPFTDVYGAAGLLGWMFTDLPPREQAGRLEGLMASCPAPWRNLAPVLEKGLAGRRFRTGSVLELRQKVVEVVSKGTGLIWASASGEDRFGHWADLTVKGVVQRMRWCPAGRFLMGSPPDEAERCDDETLHPVRLTQGFWLADTACTQAMWIAVMGSNPSHFTGSGSLPVEQVSWDECQEFLAALNRLVPGLVASLPSEAQWEYACRAGTQTPFSFGHTITPEQVNYDGNYPYAGGKKGTYRKKTVTVRSLPANHWGLYEMHGNVWEWCQDWYGEYPGGVEDYIHNSGSNRVNRGGSWCSGASLCRAAYRYGDDPGFRYGNLGFRVVAAAVPGSP